MKKLLLTIAAVVAFTASADTSISTVTYTGWQLKRGTTNVGVPHATESACITAARADAEARMLTANYSCVQTARTRVTYTAPVVVPPTCTTTQPPSETQTVACPTGTTGTWSQTRTYSAAPYPTCWAPSAWSPTTAPAGACVTPPPPPPPPPPPMGDMPMVDASRIPAPAVGSGVLQIHATSQVPQPSDIGAFRIACDYSHMNFDDAIVFPGGTGTTHLHTYFGNTGSNGQSTDQSLRTTGNSTCTGGIANRSSYWVPSMIASGGVPIRPRTIVVYYKTGYSQIRDADIRPIPAGLRMIAGNPKAIGPAPRESWQSAPSIFYCTDGSGAGRSRDTIPDCGPNTELEMHLTFPQCWDGVNLDSPDHKSHMAFRVGDSGGACPTTHPVPLPEITFNVYWPTGSTGSAGWRLSSDNYPYNGSNAGYSVHGDWFNGWDQSVSDQWTRGCINAKVDCHAGLLGNGTEIY